MQALPRDGEMVAVFAKVPLVLEAIAPYAHEVSLAAVNDPEHAVISGRRQAIRAIVAALQIAGAETKRLRVSHAFHSPLIAPVLPAFEEAVGRARISEPRMSLISNLTGGVATAELTDPAYWCRQLREPVQFAAGIETLYQQGCLGRSWRSGHTRSCWGWVVAVCQRLEARGSPVCGGGGPTGNSCSVAWASSTSAGCRLIGGASTGTIRANVSPSPDVPLRAKAVLGGAGGPGSVPGFDSRPRPSALGRSPPASPPVSGNSVRVPLEPARPSLPG